MLGFPYTLLLWVSNFSASTIGVVYSHRILEWDPDRKKSRTKSHVPLFKGTGPASSSISFRRVMTCPGGFKERALGRRLELTEKYKISGQSHVTPADPDLVFVLLRSDQDHANATVEGRGEFVAGDVAPVPALKTRSNPQTIVRTWCVLMLNEDCASPLPSSLYRSVFPLHSQKPCWLLLVRLAAIQRKRGGSSQFSALTCAWKQAAEIRLAYDDIRLQCFWGFGV